MVAFWFIGQYFGVAAKIGGHVPSATISFAILLAPYWAFGFGLGDWLHRRLRAAAVRVLAPVLLVAAYPVFALPRHQFRWDLCLGLIGVILAVTAILHRARSSKGDWRDWLVLLILAVGVELHVFDRAWPVPGLNALPKLLLLDAALYGYLVIRRLDGIGFDFRPRLVDFRVGLREFLFFTPVALLLGFAMSFLHLHRTVSNPIAFAAGWLFTLFFIAIPEELFFRGLLLNLLERRIGRTGALAATSILFGLAHFNKRTAFFNWRYVILAAIAGFFYGRAWLARRRILTPSITHATVDTVWSIWLR